MSTVAPSPVTADRLGPEERYFNRELSWLAFNRRVLEEACNASHPLLERLRFLSISASNLDEFFMVRVVGLKAHQALGIEEKSVDGLTVAQQLAAVTAEADRLVINQHEVWTDLLAGLSSAESRSMLALLQKLDPATAVLLIEHDMDIAFGFAEHVTVLAQGRVLTQGHRDEIAANRDVQQIYLGTAASS